MLKVFRMFCMHAWSLSVAWHRISKHRLEHMLKSMFWKCWIIIASISNIIHIYRKTRNQHWNAVKINTNVWFVPWFEHIRPKSHPHKAIKRVASDSEREYMP